MTEPTVRCPQCQTEIKLTESLAAPLLASTKRQYEQLLAGKEADFQKRDAELARQRAEIEKKLADLDEQIVQRLKTEREKIVAAESKKAQAAVADQISQAQADKAATELLLKERDAKLAAAQKNELELRRERLQLQEEKAQFELEMQRSIDAERAKIRAAAQKDADEQGRFKLAEKDKTITDLQVKLQDALRKAEQGSQQLQGEVQELELEGLLRGKFLRDAFEPVAKGEHGGDLLHLVSGPVGQPCGKILWESKRTKAWSDTWLAKLRGDQRAAKAEFAVIVSQVLPKDIDTFGLVEDVWITSPRTIIPVAVALRQALIEVAQARQSGEGQLTKMELTYQYLTGPRFRQRVQAIVEKFSDMQEDLDKERKYLMKQWAKRAEQIHCVIEATAGMYGDLQGIAGKTLQEIEGLDITTPDPHDDMPVRRIVAAAERQPV